MNVPRTIKGNDASRVANRDASFAAARGRSLVVKPIRRNNQKSADRGGANHCGNRDPAKRLDRNGRRESSGERAQVFNLCCACRADCGMFANSVLIRSVERSVNETLQKLIVDVFVLVEYCGDEATLRRS